MFTINTGVTVKGLNGAFFPALKEAQALWRTICSVMQSDGKQENYAWLGQLAMPREWQGKRQYKPLRDFDLTIVNKHWELSHGINRDELADDQTGQLNRRMQEQARRFIRHPDKLLVDLMTAGHAGTKGLAYDGQYFYDTDHSEGDSGSQSNDLTGAIVDKDAPTVAEWKAAFAACVVAMMSFKDDEGEPINEAYGDEGVTGLIATVPLSMYQVAQEALKAAVIAQTSNIVISPARAIGLARLTDTDTFFVHKVDDPVGPFIFQQRQAIETTIKDDPEDSEVKFLADSRYNMGFGLWQKSVRYEFTTAQG